MLNEEQLPDQLPDFSPGGFSPQKVVEEHSESNDALRHLSFRFMQDGFTIVNAIGIHVDVNPAFCAMTGFSEAELLGVGPDELYWPPGELDQIHAAFAEALRNGLSEVELTFIRKNGERFPVAVNPFAIRDENGEILFYAATVKEITQRVQMEGALRESEARFRALYEHAGDAIMIMEDNQIIDCNERTLQLFGVTRDAIMTISSFDFFPPEQPNGQNSREFFLGKVVAAQSGEAQIFEWTGDKADGTQLVIEVNMSIFMLGQKPYIQLIARDITQRKQLEEALTHSELQYRCLFDNAGDGILIMRGDQVLDCNERVLELYGITREHLLSLSNYSLSPPTQPNGQESQAFFAERIGALRLENPQIFQWTGRKLDGTPIETEVTLTTFMLDGQPCTQSLIRDITQRKQLEDALKDSEVRFRMLFESAGDAISINKNSRTIDCNKRLSELYGLSREEILSSTLGEFFPPTQPNGQDSREFFIEKVKAARSGIPQIYEWHGRKRDGSPIFTEITLTAFVLGGETYEQAIARDITQRKHMEEELLVLNKTLEERVIQRTDELERACAELLQRNVQYRTLAKKLTAAEEEERKRIAQLLHDSHQQLLVAAKLKAEMLQGVSYDAGVNKVARQILEILERALEETRSLTMVLAPPVIYGSGLVVAIQWLAKWMEEHHQLEVIVSGTLPVTPIPTDASSLAFRAVRELLFNVVKHSGVNQARVNMALVEKGLWVAVSDSGVGFDVGEMMLAHRSYGLLSIQEQLSALNGRLDISSVPQRGTICTLTIPVFTGDILSPEISPEVYRDTPETADSRHAVRRPIRILVADDHDLARAALVQALGLADDFLVVGEAVDGLDAVEQTLMRMPDVVVMDATMPKLSGLEAIRRISAEVPEVRVIGLSMHAREDMEPQMYAAGAACYLQKLSPMEDLFSSIRNVMNDEWSGAH